MVTKKLGTIKKIIIPILRRNGVVKAGIFGSYARGKETRKSDLDLLVKFKGRKSLFDLAGLELTLEEELQQPVEILTYASLNPLLKDRILKEEVRVL
jgi:predicted nucleotidyltransferase